MNRFRIILSLIVIAGTLLFVWRRQAFRELRAEQKQLQQQSEEAASLRAAIAPRPEVPAGEKPAGLSPEERAELLRLRGQAGALRQEYTTETNRLSQLTKAPRPPRPPSGGGEEMIVTRQEQQRRISNSRQWSMALLIYSQTNDGRLPNTLAEAGDLAGTSRESTNDFELVLTNQTNLNSVRSPNRTVLLREKQPWQGEDLRWRRIYAFVDGHVGIAVSDTPDFTAWEKMQSEMAAVGE